MNRRGYALLNTRAHGRLTFVCKYLYIYLLIYSISHYFTHRVLARLFLFLPLSKQAKASAPHYVKSFKKCKGEGRPRKGMVTGQIKSKNQLISHHKYQTTSARRA